MQQPNEREIKSYGSFVLLDLTPFGLYRILYVPRGFIQLC